MYYLINFKGLSFSISDGIFPRGMIEFLAKGNFQTLGFLKSGEKEELLVVKVILQVSWIITQHDDLLAEELTSAQGQICLCPAWAVLLLEPNQSKNCPCLWERTVYMNVVYPMCKGHQWKLVEKQFWESF